MLTTKSDSIFTPKNKLSNYVHLALLIVFYSEGTHETECVHAMLQMLKIPWELWLTKRVCHCLGKILGKIYSGSAQCWLGVLRHLWHSFWAGKWNDQLSIYGNVLTVMKPFLKNEITMTVTWNNISTILAFFFFLMPGSLSFGVLKLKACSIWYIIHHWTYNSPFWHEHNKQSSL